jgi:hypothetical protein
MKVSRRDALSSFLVGAGLLGLRAAATGLPARFLMNPRAALADTPTCDTSKAQFFILSTSAGGDPIGCNGPGMYSDPNIVHPADPRMAPTQLTIRGQQHTAAAPWATLPQSVLDRTCFWHLMTNTPVHPEEPHALKLMGAIKPDEMFPSLLGKQLASCLGTLQPQPVTVGARGPTEALTFNGGALPIIRPSALKATLLNPAGPLTSLQALRDQTLDQVYDLYRNEATTVQRKYLDSLIVSRQQVRGIEQNLLENLNDIVDNDIDSQIIAAVTLIQMKVTPVVAINIPFGGDNHSDPGLALETTENLSGIAALGRLMARLTSAGLQDKVTFASLNVFGRTMSKTNPINNNGRGHNEKHQMSVTISSAIKGGIIGGLAPVRNDYGCTPIDSATGAAAPGGGDITALDTLASFAKTLLASVGVDGAAIETSIPTGKVINAALA